MLKKYKPKVVAVTGSVGKTSTKDAIFAALEPFFCVRKSAKSFNSELGVPLTILGCENGWNNPLVWLRNIFRGFILALPSIFQLPASKFPEWLVLEVGADRPGDIEKLTRWITPDIAVLTRFADVPVHIEFFPSREALVAEKEYLVKALKPTGMLIINSDDADSLSIAKRASRDPVTYGMTGDSIVSVSGLEISYRQWDGVGAPSGISFSIKTPKGSQLVVLSNVLGVQHVYPILAAVAVGLAINLDLDRLVAGFKTHQPPNGRMRLISGIKHTTIIDDSYNSSPVAARVALDTLQKIIATGRKVVVFGDMLELGKESVEAHRTLGALASGVANVLITVGLRARGIAEGALQNGMSETVIFQFDTVDEVKTEISRLIQSDDIILIKGSQGVRLEKIVEEIMAEPERAGELLVRQEPEWQTR